MGENHIHFLFVQSKSFFLHYEEQNMDDGIHEGGGLHEYDANHKDNNHEAEIRGSETSNRLLSLCISHKNKQTMQHENNGHRHYNVHERHTSSCSDICCHEESASRLF